MTADELRGSIVQCLMRVDAMEAEAAQGRREAAAAESRQELVQAGLALMLALLRFVVQLPLTVVLFKAVTSDFVVGVVAAGLDATGWLALGCCSKAKGTPPTRLTGRQHGRRRRCAGVEEVDLHTN